MGTAKRERQKANRAKAREQRIKRQRMNKVRRRGLFIGVGIPLAVVALFGISQLVGGNDRSTTSTAPDDTSADVSTPTTVARDEITGETPCPKTDGTERRVTTFEQAPPTCIDASKSYTATFDTSEGTVVVDLDTKNTPGTVNNFVVLSRYKYYDGTYVFRTDTSIDIIQAGGQDNTDSPGYVIKDEGDGFKYSEGDLVMARSSGPDSGGGQFFFGAGPKVSLLDGQGTYVTFGKVSEGLDVVKAILALSAGEGALGGAPSRTVEIRTVTISEK